MYRQCLAFISAVILTFSTRRYEKFFKFLDIRYSRIVSFSFIFPELEWIWKHLYRFTQLCQYEAPLVNGLSDVYDRRKSGEAADSMDLLKLLLNKENNEEKPLTKQQVVENCFAFLLAGYETTSTALTFCTYLLAKHQDVQRKLYEEIAATKEEKGLNFDTIHSMKYLDAVFKESLRMYPPVIHFVNRVCLEDITINGQFIPKGTFVAVLPYTVHMNEENWPRAKEFIPERFLDWNDKGSLKWIPFGVGPRFCVGMRFAEMEFKMSLARLIERFELKLPENAQEMIPMVNGVIMRPKDPVNVILNKRS
ncbi:unnamed protein product [Caenorhabditis auriculariae]|uniref:Uncharacterized protein n=1 Tax=Caenorhabditis auriculariae TaxID=2777116 RepID=A0A8S1HSH5_9PELO|nr:unnamed protein product [Caenorhabditis auriculariae]